MIRIKRNHNEVIVSRYGSSALIKIPFKNEEQRKRVEANIIELFNDKVSKITIIDECGNLKRIVIP